MNRKAKNWEDLITGEKFAWSDVVPVLDPQHPEKRAMENFHFIKAEHKEWVEEMVPATEGLGTGRRAVRVRPICVVVVILPRDLFAKVRVSSREVSGGAPVFICGLKTMGDAAK